MGVEVPEVPYRAEIAEFVKELIEHIGPSAVVLFGSAARGTFGVGSDIDILIVARDMPRRFLDRLKLLNELSKTTAPMETIAYTPEEFERMVRSGQPALYDALEEGITLYDDGFFREAKDRWTRTKRDLGLVKTEHGWVKTKT